MILEPADVVSAHHRFVRAPPGVVYRTLKAIDLRRSILIHTLFLLRGLPTGAQTIDAFVKMGFVPLADREPSELTFGVAGRFWRVTGDIQALDREGFAHFEREGYARATWGFHLTPGPHDGTELHTSTRVQCFGEAARRAFMRYWGVVGPFSSLIRRETLRIIANEAERSDQE